jgi:hypothetical protein
MGWRCCSDEATDILTGKNDFDVSGDIKDMTLASCIEVVISKESKRGLASRKNVTDEWRGGKLSELIDKAAKTSVLW